MRIRAVFLLVFILCVEAAGQERSEIIGPELEGLFSRLGPGTEDTVKLRIADSVNMYLREYAASENVFSHVFGSLRFLGQVTSPDSLLKIISWNLPLEFPAGKYFSYIIRKTPSGNIVHELRSDYRQDQINADEVFHAASWYGALYYDIRPVIQSGKRHWVVLGLDYGNPLVTRKIIDVIHFDEKDELLFGKKWFDTEGTITSRVVFEYSSRAAMSLRFMSDSLIVFDHLVPFFPGMAGNRQYYAPDFSLDAFSYSGTVWKFTPNADARNKE